MPRRTGDLHGMASLKELKGFYKSCQRHTALTRAGTLLSCRHRRLCLLSSLFSSFSVKKKKKEKCHEGMALICSLQLPWSRSYWTSKHDSYFLWLADSRAEQHLSVALVQGHLKAHVNPLPMTVLFRARDCTALRVREVRAQVSQTRPNVPADI